MSKIAVIGCGVIGLPTAIALQNILSSKTKITIFTENITPNTTGDIAAGIWSPHFLGETKNTHKISKWAKLTQDFILKLWKNGQADEAGICLQNVLILSDDHKFKLPIWLNQALGYAELSEKHLKYYANFYKEKFTGGYSYVSFSWEGSKLLSFLQKTFLENGGTIQIKKIYNLEELSDFDAIVNCTGLNARELISDSSVKPIRGQVTRVYAPWQFHTITIATQKGGYIIPNTNSVVLGGIYQLDNFNTKVDKKDKQKILSGCYHYVPSLKNAPILQNSAGLRPYREQVRLEAEIKTVNNKNIKIVHNYGHGGGGITLSIGCAQEAAHLVKEILNWNNRSKL